MNKIEPGVLAITKNMKASENNGKLVRVDRPYRGGEILPNHRYGYSTNFPGWVCESLCSPLSTDLDGMQMVRNIAGKCLHAIGDQPGNESFVVKARKTLPRPTPVTGPVTINERGEPA